MEKPKVNATFSMLPKGYTYEVKGARNPHELSYKCYHVSVITPEGKMVDLIGKDDRPIAFKEEPDIVYAIGDMRDTLVKNYINNDEEYHIYKHGYGARTKKYLDACRGNIGFLNHECGENLTIGDDWENIGDFAVNSSDIYMRRDERGYVAAYQIQFEDAVFEHRYIFDRRPTKKTVKDAELIVTVEMHFRSWNRDNEGESYTCWECGHTVAHWLDIEGGLKEKYEKLKDKYCGC
jgi:hypothetical protein